jgi:glycosyltransferase involved in cell wall biosynthesis
MDISVIVPVYNEEPNIIPLVNELTDVLNTTSKTFEMIFVDDGSTDNTLSELKKIQKDPNELKIIELTRNFGQTPSIMAGFHTAKGNIVITMDGDLQNDPHDIPKLLEKIEEGNDMVCGWRKKRKDNFLIRTLPSKIANRLINALLKTPLHDYGCTLKAYKLEILKDLKLYGEMHRFIPAIASWNGAKIAELEVNHRARRFGKTKYGLNRIIRVLLDLLLLTFLSEYSTKPIRFFGGLSILSAIAGSMSFILLVYMKLALNIDMTGNPFLIMCALFFLVSVQFLSMGFLGEINIRTYYESQDKKTYFIRKNTG